MSGRSFTDPFTSQTVFSSSELLEDLPELIDPHRAPPPHLLPTFLHEATHHWCFTSLVGTTIALLGMRGRICALKAVEAGTPEEATKWEERAADDLVRAQVATQLLEPLAEGMASFAEFDLGVSLRSPAVPPPLRWAMMFSARDYFVGSVNTSVRQRLDVAEITLGELAEVRGSERARRAKEALLSQPLDCTSSPGYLAGYLFMKALWNRMQSRYDQFRESDVFLLKVYETIYGDGKFAALLVDSSRRIPDALNPLAPYLVERFKYAFGATKDDLQGFYESLVSARSELSQGKEAFEKVVPVASPTDADPVGLFPALWDVIMGTPMGKLPTPNAESPPSQIGITAMNMIGHGRDLLELGSVQAELDVGEQETIVKLRGTEVARLPNLSSVFGEIRAGQTNGAVHILLNVRSGKHVVAAKSGDGRLVAFRQTPEARENELISASRSIVGRIHGTQIANSILLGAKDGLSRMREFSRIDGYLQQTRERLSALYVTFATDHVPDSVINDLISKMMQDGVYGAFDHKADLVRALAMIGSTIHVYQSPSLLKSEFEKQGLDYDRLMQELRDYSRSTNLFYLVENFGVVRSSL